MLRVGAENIQTSHQGELRNTRHKSHLLRV